MGPFDRSHSAIEMLLPANVLFGESSKLNARKTALNRSVEYDFDSDDATSRSVQNVQPATPSGTMSFFFGFMLEEPLDDDEILKTKRDTVPIWNPLNTALFLAYCLTSAATAVPVTLVSSMSETLLVTTTSSNGQEYDASSSFAPRVTAWAVLGTAVGKFTLSSMGDICGARRTAVVFSVLLACSLIFLSLCQSAKSALWACFLVEFCQSVQWPCIIVILATHYRQHGHAVYEGGIYVTSLASRFGVLMGIPLSSMLLRVTHWRVVALVGAWAALIASSLMYLFVTDSAGRTNDPQNPIDPQLLQQWQRKPTTFGNLLKLAMAIYQNNVAASLKHIFKSPAFYIVAVAHTGSSAVRTSERILGTYFRDTSLESLSENRAGSLAVFLSLGTISGLVVAGHFYTKGTERERKRLVTKLYISTIISCYVLAVLAIPGLRTFWNAPELVLVFQVMATFVMGFSIAVQLYQLPSLVGATFGCDKGLYAGYTDGVAYALSSLVWRIVGNSVQHDGSSGAGWAYGWAAVALILILSALVMVEFMEHYFVRPGVKASEGYETIMFA